MSAVIIATSLFGAAFSFILYFHQTSGSGGRGPSKLHTTAIEHIRRVEKVVESLRSRKAGSKISLHRRPLQSNTIRNGSHKSEQGYHPVDLSSFTRIIEVHSPDRDADASASVKVSQNEGIGYVVCEPGITFGKLLPELLKVGLAPLVVIEFPEITIGGAISGGGLESASHRYGQFMDTVLEIECVVPTSGSQQESPDATIYKCSPTTHSDLFYALSASYNTVALVTSVKIQVKPAKSYVDLELQRYTKFQDAVAALSEPDPSGIYAPDTLEGIAYSVDDIVVIRGRYTDSPGGDIGRFSRHWDRWYYKVIRDLASKTGLGSGSSHTLSTKTRGSPHTGVSAAPNRTSLTVPFLDYSFRYNHGAFWMASFILDILGDSLFTRLLFGWLLDTKHLFAVLHSSKLADLGRMRVIQDCYIPVAGGNARKFLEWEAEEVGVWPLWLCPVKGTREPQWLACNHVVGKEGERRASGGWEFIDGEDTGHSSDPGATDPTFFINVGIYGRPGKFPFDAPALNSALVDALVRYSGRSMLYAQTWHTPNQFEAIYGSGMRRIDQVKQRYSGGLDQASRNDQSKEDCFYGLYEKVALKEREREEMARPIVDERQRGGIAMSTEEMENAAHWRILGDIVRSKLGLSMQ